MIHACFRRGTVRAPVAILLLALLLPLAGPAVVHAQTPGTWASHSTSGGMTFVNPPALLQPLVEDGGVPADLAQLRALEQQQQAITRLAEQCTVNVQIQQMPIGSTQGCGVIITDDGYVLTAAHVAERPGLEVQVTLNDGRRVSAKTLGMNRGVDAGMIKIDDGQNGGRPWPHATLGTSDQLEAGMWCIATGHPGGYDASRGMVARVGRILAVRPGAIVTDCALIGGDSGGPLFDLAGRLIAVHSRIGNDVADNLHVPVSYYDQGWQDMAAGKAWGFLPGFRPVLGVTGSGVADRAEVLEVRRGSPAEQAGIRAGDVIERFGDEAIDDFEALQQAVNNTMPGKRVLLRLNRGGETVRLVVEIGRDPNS